MKIAMPWQVFLRAGCLCLAVRATDQFHTRTQEDFAKWFRKQHDQGITSALEVKDPIVFFSPDGVNQQKISEAADKIMSDQKYPGEVAEGITPYEGACQT